jgi:acetyl-CoA acyltransferase
MQVREKGMEGEAPPFTADETIRPGTSREKLATLKTSFRTDGRLTAGNSSQISDGAAVLLLMSAVQGAETRRLKPRARMRRGHHRGLRPDLMLTGPIAATHKVLAQAGLRSTTSTSSRSTKPSRRCPWCG